MKPKLVLLAMFAAILCYSFVNNSLGLSQEKAAPGNVHQRTKGLERRELVADGKCVALLKYDPVDDSKFKVDLDTGNSLNDKNCTAGNAADPANPADPATKLSVNGKPLTYNSGSITFGDGTTTCYGPPIPSPPRCVCTAKPCP